MKKLSSSRTRGGQVDVKY